MKNTRFETARIHRGYGQFLFQQGRLDEAREQFRRTLEFVVGSTDVDLSFRGNTLERLAALEEEFGDKTQVESALLRALEIYQGFHHSRRKQQETERLVQLLSDKSVDRVNETLPKS